MSKTAKIIYDGKEYEIPVVIGTEGEIALDITKLRPTTGLITLDPGYGSTGSCKSAITFINGEKGILRYRGYAIEDLAEKSSFVEVVYLLIHGELPTKNQLDEFKSDLTRHTLIHEDMKHLFEGFPPNAHPMAILSAMITSLSTYYPKNNNVDLDIIRLLAKSKTIAAFSYKKSIGQPYIYPRNDLDYISDFLHMMFALPTEEYKVNPTAVKALDQLLILHADHEQNCSASTVRMVGSSKGSIYSTISAGVSALWGPLHGGANQQVLDMLNKIQKDNNDVDKYVKMAKDKSSGFRLMGFGHRVYKNFDPRAKILKKAADALLKELGVDDPLLDIAKKLEAHALEDEYFIEKKLYPNVDFYSGIIYRALGIPENMFTVMFALGRLPGWIAQWKENMADPSFRIHRPRQVYIGPNLREFLPIERRG
jgi:citrate synthase